MKRLFSSFLCVAIVMTALSIPVTAFVEQKDTHNVSDGVIYSENFESSLDGFSATSVETTQNTEENGNGYYTISPSDGTAAFSAMVKPVGSVLLPNTTITFDLRCEKEGMPFLISAGRPSSLEKRNIDDSISYGTTVTAVVSFSSDTEKGSGAQFYVNGQPYGGLVAGSSTFEQEISGFKIGTNTVFARIYCESGLIVQSEPQLVKVDYSEEKAFDVGREYEIDYKYTTGSGKIILSDGYFKVTVNHAQNRVRFMTAEGSKICNVGSGDYKIIVASGHAEIYWNGQFLQSILLTYDTSEASIQYQNVSDFVVKSSGVKAELFSINSGDSFETDAIPSTQYYSVEFNKNDSSEEEIYINDGRFTTTLYFRNDGIFAKSQLVQAAPAEEQKLSDSVEAGYYRLTVAHGIAQLFLNNEPIGNFRCVLGGSTPKIKRTVTNSESSDFFALKKTDDVYYHSESFDGKNELSYEDYWQAGPINYRTAASEGGVVAELSTAEGGNNYMKLEGTGVYVLNGTDQYPTIKWRGRADEASGKFFALLRQSFVQQHTKIGYDFDSQNWFFEIMDMDGKISNTSTLTAPGAIEAGEWYDFEVVCNGYTVSLFVNGEQVFKKELPTNDLDLIHYGRFGLGVDSSTYSFDDFCYVGKNRVTPGASTFVPLQFLGEDINSQGSYAVDQKYAYVGDVDAFYKDTDGTVYGIATEDTSKKGNLKSSDNGKTWERANGGPFTRAINDYVQMPDGTLVGLVRGNAKLDTPQYSIISKDGGKTWSKPYLIHDGTYGYIGTGDRLRSTMDGRVFAVFSSGYEDFTRFTIFYSDDGMNWHRSNPEYITHYETGIVCDEQIVVDTPRENEVWLYFRSNTGFVTYYKSFDNGKTFDLTPHFSGLPSVCSTYSIERDWDNPDTYYAVFVYDTVTSVQSRNGWPRNRYSMAVSHDGMESWEFVSDLIATNDVPYIYMSDMNMYHFGDGQLYWTVHSLQGPGLKMMGVQEIDKMKSVKRMPEMHFRHLLGFDPVENAAQRQCVVSKTKGIAWIYGDYYTAQVEDGRVDLGTAEKIFGITSTVSGSTVTLKLGGGSVVLTNGSTSYKVNGTNKTASRAVASSGYVDLEVLCEVFGKVFRETEGSYCIMNKVEVMDIYQELIDELV